MQKKKKKKKHIQKNFNWNWFKQEFVNCSPTKPSPMKLPLYAYNKMQ